MQDLANARLHFTPSVDTGICQATISSMKLDDCSDEELAMMVAAGRNAAQNSAEFGAAQDAFSVLYDRNAISVRSFICSRLSNDAKSRLQDTCQEVWLRAWNKADSFRRTEKYLGWLFKIARNLIIDNARASARKPEQTSEAIEARPDTSPLPEFSLIQNEIQVALAECLGTLDTLEAQVLRLRLAGMKYPDLSEELGIDIKVAYKKWDTGDTGKKKMADCMEAKQV